MAPCCCFNDFGSWTWRKPEPQASMHLVFENLDYSGLQFWSILSNFRCMLQHLPKDVGSPESSYWTPLAHLIRDPECWSSQQVEGFGQDGEWYNQITMSAFLWTTCTASKIFSHHHCYHPQSNHPFDYWPSIGFLQYHPFLPPAKPKASSYAWEYWKVSFRQALDYSASRKSCLWLPSTSHCLWTH